MIYLVLGILVLGSWGMFAQSGNEIKVMNAQVTALQEQGEPDSDISKLETKIHTLSSQRIFTGVLLAFLSAGFVGIFFVFQILPSLAQRVTHAIYDSAEMIERDVMHDARSLMAQGDYQGAIEAFRQAAAADPLNRLPWVEITRIYKEKLDDPASAIQTVRHALESQEWQVNDAAYLLFRLAELYDECQGNRASAISIMQQVIREFPETRHSANANHKLHSWSLEEAEAHKIPRPSA